MSESSPISDQLSRSEGELLALISQLCDGTITPESRDQLEKRLRQDPQAVAQYRAYVRLHVQLQHKHRRGMAEVPFLGPVVTTDSEAPAVGPVAAKGVRTTFDRALEYLAAPERFSWLAAATILAVFLAVLSVIRMPVADGPPEPPAAKRQESLAKVRKLDVHYAASGNPGDRPALVVNGQQIAIEQGYVEVLYDNGTVVFLHGPANYKVTSKESGYLRRGSLTADVPTSGHGFTIRSPRLKVIDLGTRFGVVATDQGIAQVHVLEGEVETFIRDHDGKYVREYHLTGGEAIQLKGESNLPRRIAVDRERFERPLDEKRQSSKNKGSAR